MFLAPCRFPRCRVECEMHSPAHLHKGVTYTVHEILTFITRLISFCLQSLHHRFVDWTKPSNTALILGTLTDLSQSKSELVAENALLRRHMKRPACTKTDRMLLVLLARMVRAWKQAHIARSGRRRYCGGIARVSGSSGRTNPEQLLAHQRYPQRSWP
jgi:hypothetical protein